MAQRKVSCEVYTDRGIVGPKGDDGTPNSLSIGTVEGGETAAATITGEAPNQTLNLVLPKGDKGDEGADGQDGYSPTATVTKSGSVATITITDKNGTTTATVSDGTGSVTDVQVDGVSVVSSGVASITSELPSQTGQSGKFLTTNGSAASWSAVDSLPSQTGHSGEFLTTDGSSASWGSIPAGVSADGTTIENVSNVFTTIGVKDQNTATAKKFWTGTKDEYDAIVTKDPNTTYITTDEESDPGGGGGGGDGADTSLSNLTDAGKIQVATLSAPSDTYDDLTLGASGATYTMPSDGFLTLWMSMSGAYSNMAILNPSAGRAQYQFAAGTIDLAITMPVHKGEVMTVYYGAAGGANKNYFRFFYAKGNESEKA